MGQLSTVAMPSFSSATRVFSPIPHSSFTSRDQKVAAVTFLRQNRQPSRLLHGACHLCDVLVRPDPDCRGKVGAAVDGALDRACHGNPASSSSSGARGMAPAPAPAPLTPQSLQQPRRSRQIEERLAMLNGSTIGVKILQHLREFERDVDVFLRISLDQREVRTSRSASAFGIPARTPNFRAS